MVRKSLLHFSGESSGSSFYNWKTKTEHKVGRSAGAIYSIVKASEFSGLQKAHPENHLQIRTNPMNSIRLAHAVGHPSQECRGYFSLVVMELFTSPSHVWKELTISLNSEIQPMQVVPVLLHLPARHIELNPNRRLCYISGKGRGQNGAAIFFEFSACKEFLKLANSCATPLCC